MLNNLSIYFPAMSVGTQLTCMEKNYAHIKSKKSFRFYEKDSLFYHPYLLISAGHNFKKNTMDALKYDLNTTLVLGDSGGYQIGSEKLVLTDELRNNLFNWLENNTNYAINLDIPPYGAYSNRKKGIFEDNTSVSVKNFEFFKKNASGKTKYLNVLHGRGRKDLDYWYERVKDFNFEGGWSIGSVFGNIYFILLSFFYLWEKGEIEKCSNLNALIHILGFSRNASLYIILYLQEKLNEKDINVKISYDSSSPFMLAAYGKYTMFSKKDGSSPISFSNSIIKNKESINLDLNLFCKCPVCKDMKLQDLFSFSTETGYKTEFYYYLSMHNFYAFLDYKEKMENLLLTANTSIYESLFTQKDFALFRIIDQAFNEKNSSEFIEKNKIQIATLTDDESIVMKSFF